MEKKGHPSHTVCFQGWFKPLGIMDPQRYPQRTHYRRSRKSTVGFWVLFFFFHFRNIFANITLHQGLPVQCGWRGVSVVQVRMRLRKAKCREH